MFSVAPNIVLAPNMTQNAERKHRTQNTNTAHIRPPQVALFNHRVAKSSNKIPRLLNSFKW